MHPSALYDFTKGTVIGLQTLGFQRSRDYLNWHQENDNLIAGHHQIQRKQYKFSVSKDILTISITTERSPRFSTIPSGPSEC